MLGGNKEEEIERLFPLVQQNKEEENRKSIEFY